MSARAFTILDAISDQRLFGAAFRDLSTWPAWRAFLAGLFGIAMSEAQAEVYRACTGRSGLPDRPFLAVGEKCTIMVVAADRKQARVVLRFVRGLLAAPVLAKRVVNDVSDAIELQGDVVIEVITASHAVRVTRLARRWLTSWRFFRATTPRFQGWRSLRRFGLRWRRSLTAC
jgi:hypothetical protein